MLRLYPTRMSTPLQSWVDRIRAGDVRALARAISTGEDDRLEARELLKALFPFTGHARVIGLTGAPGAGKSTLVDHLAREYRKEGRTVGIVAVDPTSPYTGGAILGDRIRMQAKGRTAWSARSVPCNRCPCAPTNGPRRSSRP